MANIVTAHNGIHRVTDVASVDSNAKTFSVQGDMIVKTKNGPIVMSELLNYLKSLEDRVSQLETAYMEEKLLGKCKDPGTIG